jgi:hypothetical protein
MKSVLLVRFLTGSETDGRARIGRAGCTLGVPAASVYTAKVSPTGSQATEACVSALTFKARVRVCQSTYSHQGTCVEEQQRFLLACACVLPEENIHFEPRFVCL